MSEDFQKIKINLADRVYPLTIRRREEENVRRAAQAIQAAVKEYEANFAVRDKQDSLAMAALQMAARLEKQQSAQWVDGQRVGQSLEAIEAKIQQALQ